MKGNFDRFSFDEAKNRLAVLMQQGKIQLPSEFNESAEILLRLNQTSNRDVIGKKGSPNDGFRCGSDLTLDACDSLDGWSVLPDTGTLELEHFKFYEGKSSLKTSDASSLTKTFESPIDLSKFRSIGIYSNRNPGTIILTDTAGNSVTPIQSNSQISPDWIKGTYLLRLLDEDIDLTSIHSITFNMQSQPTFCFFDNLFVEYLHPVCNWNTAQEHPFWRGSLDNTDNISIDTTLKYNGASPLHCSNKDSLKWNFEKPIHFFAKDTNSGQSFPVIDNLSIEMSVKYDDLQLVLLTRDGSYVLNVGGVLNNASNTRFLHKFSLSDIPEFPDPQNPSSWLLSIEIKRSTSESLDSYVGTIFGTPSPNDVIVQGEDITNHEAGKMYCGGILSKKHFHNSLYTQHDCYDPHLNVESSGDGHGKVFYLDKWEKVITPIEDPAILEEAVNVETTLRLEQKCQVRFTDVDDPHVSCESINNNFDELFPNPTGTLTTGTATESDVDDPCEIPPVGGYRGDNRLYRVEIHQGGDTNNDTIIYKWSQNNAATQSKITHFIIPADGSHSAFSNNADKVIVDSLGKDKILSFKIGDFVQIVDERFELAQYGNTAPVGELRQITDIDVESNSISFAPTDSNDNSPYHAPLQHDYGVQFHAKIIKWDGVGTIDDNSQISLNDGVVIQFGSGKYFSQDYWTFKTRETNRTVERLFHELPHGPKHEYCALGYLDKNEEYVRFYDCRNKFNPLTGLTASDIAFDETSCDFCDDKNIDTVQQALEDLCQRPTGICSKSVNGKSGQDIQDAIDDLTERGIGGVVCIPSGIYKIIKPIRITRDDIVLRGEGISTRLIPQYAIDSVIDTYGKSNIGIENIAIISPNPAVNLSSGTRNCEITHCVFFSGGITLIKLNTDTANITLSHNIFAGFRYIEIFSGTADKNNISQFNLFNNKIFCYEGIYFNSAKDINAIFSDWNIQSNWISGLRNSIDFNRLKNPEEFDELLYYMLFFEFGLDYVNGLIHGGTLRDFAKIKFAIFLSGITCKNFFINNNTMIGGRGGITIINNFTHDKPNLNIFIADNTFSLSVDLKNTVQTRIESNYFLGGEIKLNGISREVEIINNIFYSNSIKLNAYDDRWGSSNSIHIDNNLFLHDKKYGIFETLSSRFSELKITNNMIHSGDGISLNGIRSTSDEQIIHGNHMSGSGSVITLNQTFHSKPCFTQISENNISIIGQIGRPQAYSLPTFAIILNQGNVHFKNNVIEQAISQVPYSENSSGGILIGENNPAKVEFEMLQKPYEDIFFKKHGQLKPLILFKKNQNELSITKNLPAGIYDIYSEQYDMGHIIIEPNDVVHILLTGFYLHMNKGNILSNQTFQNITIKDNIFHGGLHNCLTISSHLDNFTIVGNTIADFSASAITVTHPDIQINSLVISNNIIQNCFQTNLTGYNADGRGTDNAIILLSMGNDIRITDNDIQNTNISISRTGANYYGDSLAAIQLTGGTNTTISDNTINIKNQLFKEKFNFQLDGIRIPLPSRNASLNTKNVSINNNNIDSGGGAISIGYLYSVFRFELERKLMAALQADSIDKSKVTMATNSWITNTSSENYVFSENSLLVPLSDTLVAAYDPKIDDVINMYSVSDDMSEKEQPIHSTYSITNNILTGLDKNLTQIRITKNLIFNNNLCNAKRNTFLGYVKACVSINVNQMLVVNNNNIISDGFLIKNNDNNNLELSLDIRTQLKSPFICFGNLLTGVTRINNVVHRPRQNNLIFNIQNIHGND